MQRILNSLTVLLLTALPSLADRDRYVDLARQGWNYELRTTMVGRDMSIPIQINGRTLAGAGICMVGDPPHSQSTAILNAFSALMEHVYSTPLPLNYAGNDASKCGAESPVVLRLYSGYPPNTGLTLDLSWLNDRYDLGLPDQRFYAAPSPAMGQTFFGRQGQGTHLMVKQPAHRSTSPLETAFYRSILIEELYQSFTFGMDLLHFDDTVPFLSKLEETPLNIQRLPWGSKPFMRSLVNSNPSGLCLFDIFMLHAIAEAPVEETVDPDFIAYVEDQYTMLLDMAQTTAADPVFAPLIVEGCARTTF